jgi:hypothetical protein
MLGKTKPNNVRYSVGTKTSASRTKVPLLFFIFVDRCLAEQFGLDFDYEKSVLSSIWLMLEYRRFDSRKRLIGSQRKMFTLIMI